MLVEGLYSSIFSQALAFSPVCRLKRLPREMEAEGLHPPEGP